MQTSTQPRARRGVPRGHSAPVALSPAATKLIQQIEAEARARLLEDLSAKDGITVLHPLDADTKRIHIEGDDIHIRDGRGGNVRLYRRREEPESWRNSRVMAGWWSPAHWAGYMELVDAAGIKWERNLGDMVCDDFGNLVEVSA